MMTARRAASVARDARRNRRFHREPSSFDTVMDGEDVRSTDGAAAQSMADDDDAERAKAATAIQARVRGRKEQSAFKYKRSNALLQVQQMQQHGDEDSDDPLSDHFDVDAVQTDALLSLAVTRSHRRSAL